MKSGFPAVAWEVAVMPSGVLTLLGSTSEFISWWGLGPWAPLLLIQGRTLKVHLDGVESLIIFLEQIPCW